MTNSRRTSRGPAVETHRGTWGCRAVAVVTPSRIVM